MPKSIPNSIQKQCDSCRQNKTNNVKYFWILIFWPPICTIISRAPSGMTTFVAPWFLEPLRGHGQSNLYANLAPFTFPKYVSCSHWHVGPGMSFQLFPTFDNLFMPCFLEPPLGPPGRFLSKCVFCRFSYLLPFLAFGLAWSLLPKSPISSQGSADSQRDNDSL